MADRFAAEVRKSLNKQAFMSRADPTTKYATEGENGRSDLVVLKNKRGCAVEIKAGLSGFNFNEWRDNQREWATTWCMTHSQIDYWIWLVLGDAPPMFYKNIPAAITQQRKYPRQSWLVPYMEWCEVEKQIREYQNTIPYLAGKGYNEDMQELHLDVWHVLNIHHLEWVKGKGQAFWKIPEQHTFSKFFNS